MKIRKVKRYTCGGFWGTCEKWAEQLEDDGYEVATETVLWVGKVPVCPSCLHGVH